MENLRGRCLLRYAATDPSRHMTSPKVLVRRSAAAAKRPPSGSCATGIRTRGFPSCANNPAEIRSRASLEDAARENRALDLTRPLPDPVDTELAKEPRGRT